MTQTTPTISPQIRTPVPLWAVRLVFAACIFVMLLMFTGGAISPWAFGFGGLVVTAMLLPVLGVGLPRAIRLREDNLGWVLLAGLVFLSWSALQLIPLSPGLLTALSPEAARVRRDMGGWNGIDHAPISLVPALTQQTLLIWSVGFLVFITTMLTVRSQRLRTFSHVIAIGTGVWACYGLVLFVLPSSWLEFKGFGVPNIPGRVSGPLVNPNRFSYLLELGLPFSLLHLYSTVQEYELLSRKISWRVRLHTILTNRPHLTRLVFWLINTMFLLAALMLSRSRGGFTAVILSLLAGLVLFGLRRDEHHGARRKQRTRASIGLILLVLVIVFNVGMGSTGLLQRFDQLFTEKVDRLQLWESVLVMVRKYLLTGTGAGTFRDVFAAYQAPELEGSYKFAHNEYLNTIADCGLPGLLIVFVFLNLWFRSIWRKIKGAQSEAGHWRRCILIGVIAVACHQVTDYGTQDPAVLWYLALLMGLGLCPSGSPTAEANTMSVEIATSSALTANSANAPGLSAGRPGPLGPAGKFYPRKLMLQGGLILVAATALVQGLLFAPYACSDWVRPGTLWLHLDWLLGGVQGDWTADQLIEWKTGWESAESCASVDPIADYQIATAEFFLLRQTYQDQPLLAPGIMQADGSIQLTRLQTPREISPADHERIRAARTRVERALLQSPARMEYHLLQLRLAALDEDFALVYNKWPQVMAMYSIMPNVLGELTEDLVFELQRGDPALTPAEFEARMAQVSRLRLACTKDFRAPGGFLLNRGVSTNQLISWSPVTTYATYQMASFLQGIRRYDDALPLFDKVVAMADTTPEEQAMAHNAMMQYLAVCMVTERYEEFRKRVPQVLAKLQDFEVCNFYNQNILPGLSFDTLELQQQDLLLDDIAPSKVDAVEAARCQVRGTIAYRLGNYDDAKKLLDIARRLYPDAAVLRLRAQVAEQQNQFSEAARFLEEALEKSPNNRVMVMRQMAGDYVRAGDNYNALDTYRMLMSIDPDHRTQYASMVGRLGATEEAPKTGQ